jgi:hypothetical protein
MLPVAKDNSRRVPISLFFTKLATFVHKRLMYYGCPRYPLEYRLFRHHRVPWGKNNPFSKSSGTQIKFQVIGYRLWVRDKKAVLFLYLSPITYIQSLPQAPINSLANLAVFSASPSRSGPFDPWTWQRRVRGKTCSPSFCPFACSLPAAPG